MGRDGPPQSRAARLGKAALFVLFSPFLLLALPIILVLIPLGLVINFVRGGRLQRAFAAKYGAQGKDLVLVYSDSPHWKTYIETNWLPKYAARAVVLNWSARSRWTREQYPESEIFRYFSGMLEYNPIAIVVPDTGKVQVVRFWRAFRDFKHGKDAALRKAEAQLDRYLSP